MPTSSALKLARAKPVDIKLTGSPLSWRRIGKLVEFEMVDRDWTLDDLCAHALHPSNQNPMCGNAARKLIAGDYYRGPHVATLIRVFVVAFKSSGYEINISQRGTHLRRV